MAVWAVALGLRDGGTTQDTWLFVVGAGSVTTAAVGALIGGKTGNATGWLLAVGGVGLRVGALLGQAASGCGEPAALTAIPATFSATPGWQVAGSVAGVAVWGACLVTAVTLLSVRPVEDAGRVGCRTPIARGTGIRVDGRRRGDRCRLGCRWARRTLRATSDRLCGTPFPGTARPPALTAGVVLLAFGAAAALAIAWRRERAVSGSDRAQLLPMVATATAATLALATTLLITEPGPLWGDSWPIVLAWALAAFAIGANIGTSVVPLLRLFGADRGIAVEPAPGNVELLLLNIELNDLAGRVDVIPVGASDRDGFLELALSAENSGDHRMRVGTDDVFERSSVTVQVHRVDTLVETGALDPSDLTLVWLDVQGHEGHVLSGATSILRGSVPGPQLWPWRCAAPAAPRVRGRRCWSTSRA